MTDNRISELLSEAMTDVGRPVNLGQVADRVRAQRRVRLGVAGVCVLGLAAVGAVVVTAPSTSPRSARLVTDPTPTPTHRVTLEGLTFPLPAVGPRRSRRAGWITTPSLWGSRWPPALPGSALCRS